MPKMIKFPKIRQFRDVIRDVKLSHDFKGKDEEGNPIYSHETPYPTLKFEGTVKLHGTNASVVYGKSAEDYYFQSRSRIITPDDDNAGFASFMSALPRDVHNCLTNDISQSSCGEIAIYGEWCGGTIQKGVAINGLPKMFVVFCARKVYETGEKGSWLDFSELNLKLWEERLNPHNIYHINQFKKFSIDIDFDKPELSAEELAKLTNEVGQECPVGKYFGKTGVGEGIVWKCVETDWNSSKYWFKVKDERHSVSKVKTLAPVDVEKMRNVDEFVENHVTENRLAQGIEALREQGKDIDIKNTGEYIRWVFNDVVSEESVTLETSGLSKKDIGAPISKKAKEYFFNYLSENI